jgi:hypothetical protein
MAVKALLHVLQRLSGGFGVAAPLAPTHPAQALSDQS